MIYQFTLVYQQRQAKKEMKQKIRRRLSERDLEMFAYAEHEREIDWEEEGKEFRLHGEMYDVVKASLKDGQLVLYCINDKKENELIQKYLNLFKQKNSTDKKPRGASAMLLFSHSSEVYTFFSQSVVCFTSQLLCGLPMTELDLITPPPKV